MRIWCAEVEARSGYQLQLDGPLRWHIWPQLSILSGRMTLTAPGAQTAVVKADNMRLDVALWPLLSHQLQVKQVMLKGAIIQLTPAKQSGGAKRCPGGAEKRTRCLMWQTIAAGHGILPVCRWRIACWCSSMMMMIR